MTRLVVATSNPGKLREFAEALAAAGIEAVGLGTLGVTTAIEETGSTFEDNARLKAEGYSRLTDLAVVADDSGLEVDALGGAPGVASARYGGPGLDDAARVRLLLRELSAIRDPERRTARFRCVLALARAGKVEAVFHGAVEGRITFEPQGHHGFGYDPVFFHPPSACTFAELSTEQKRHVSHRGQAIAELVRGLSPKGTVPAPRTTRHPCPQD